MAEQIPEIFCTSAVNKIGLFVLIIKIHKPGIDAQTTARVGACRLMGRSRFSFDSPKGYDV